MEQTKKILCSVLLFFILFNCLLPTVAFADMGPKPRVHIIVENPPEEYYLDLLTKNELGCGKMKLALRHPCKI